MSTKLALVGAVESTEVTLGTLLARGFDPLVLTLPPELGHRHSDYVDLAARFPEHRRRIVAVDRVAEPDNVARLAEEELDVLLVFGWSQMCPPEVIATARTATLGCHPSALPLNRGRGVIPWTIVQGTSETAFSVFHLAAGVDDGDIAVQVPVAVDRRETARTLYDKHMAALRTALDVLLDDLTATGRVPRTPQDHSRATWCARRDAEDGRLDLHAPAAVVDRLVRASGRPYPGAFTTSGEAVVRVWAAHDVDADRHWARPGQVVEVDGAALTVMCGDGRAVVLDEWEVEGSGRPPRLHGQIGPRR